MTYQPSERARELAEIIEGEIMSVTIEDKRTMAEVAEPLIQSALTEAHAEGYKAGLEAALNAARTTRLRVHAEDDVDFHSGCVQTQERIVDAIRRALAPTDGAGKA